MKKYNSYTEKHASIDDMFNDIFPLGIPNNAYIDKSKTGLGMTFSEFYALRNSIIVVPSLAIIHDKAEAYRELKPLKLYNETEDEEIEKYLKDNAIKYKKIITTPESFGRLMNDTEEIGLLTELYTNYFCLLDEVHCYITETQRKEILTPFDHFWNFNNKAIGTATSYQFSDPLFNQLDYIKIKYDQGFGTIKLIVCDHPNQGLSYILHDLSRFPGRVHIFLNSIKLINAVINKAKLKDVAIFCADEEKNLFGLGENRKYFRVKPCKSNYAKVNIYSAKYVEGWDLEDNENCTIILMTNVKVPYSVAMVQYKAFQAVGRLRSEIKINGKPKAIKPNAIYHVTNTNPEDRAVNFNSFDTIKQNWFFEASSHIDYYNSYNDSVFEAGMKNKGSVMPIVEKFGRLKNDRAILLPTKVDQHIYDEYFRQFYNSTDRLKEAWESMNYEVTIKKIPEDLKIHGEKKQDKNKRIIEYIENLNNGSLDYDELAIQASLSEIRRMNSDLLESYYALGYEKIVELNFDDRKMKAKRINLSNKKHYSAIGKELIEELETETKLAPQTIKDLISEKFVKYAIYDGKGKAKKPQIKMLTELFGIEFIKKGKTDYVGKKVPAIVIIGNT